MENKKYWNFPNFRPPGVTSSKACSISILYNNFWRVTHLTVLLITVYKKQGAELIAWKSKSRKFDMCFTHWVSRLSSREIELKWTEFLWIQSVDIPCHSTRGVENDRWLFWRLSDFVSSPIQNINSDCNRMQIVIFLTRVSNESCSWRFPYGLKLVPYGRFSFLLRILWHAWLWVIIYDLLLPSCNVWKLFIWFKNSELNCQTVF